MKSLLLLFITSCTSPVLIGPYHVNGEVELDTCVPASKPFKTILKVSEMDGLVVNGKDTHEFFVFEQTNPRWVLTSNGDATFEHVYIEQAGPCRYNRRLTMMLEFEARERRHTVKGTFDVGLSIVENCGLYINCSVRWTLDGFRLVDQ